MWERRLKAVAGVIAPTTVLTALMVYFGYVYEYAFYDYFSVDLETLRLSNQQLLLNSVTALYVPFGALLAAGVAGLWIHSVVDGAIRGGGRRRELRTGAVAALVLGSVLLLRGVWGVVVPDVARTEAIATSPICLGTGAILVAYGRHMFRRLTPPSANTTRVRWPETGALVLIAGITVLSMFWAANSVAHAHGRGDAIDMSGTLASRPGIILDTKERLDIVLPGMTEYSLPGPTFKYRYRGLRLLVEAHDRLLLVTDAWEKGDGKTLVIADDDSIRTILTADPLR